MKHAGRVARLLGRECRCRYEFPDVCCFTTVNKFLVEWGYSPVDVAHWAEGEDADEMDTARQAIREHGSVTAAIAHVLEDTGAYRKVRWPGDEAHVKVYPGDLVILKAGLLTQEGGRTVPNQFGFIGPECRPWVWGSRGMSPVVVAWRPPRMLMRFLPTQGGD